MTAKMTAYEPERPPRMRSLIAITALALAAGIAAGGCSSAPATTYKARAQDYTVINPADLAVTIRITNTGSAAGTPECTIQASDPSGAYTGTDIVTKKSPLAAGASVVAVDNLTVTSQGARFVTSVTVSCK